MDWSELLGAAFLNDESFYSSLSPGQTGRITFDFISPTTELVVSGPEIASVAYEFIPDLDDVSQLVLLGTSFDQSTNFGIDFTMVGFNQVIFATPLDANGSPIIIPGAEGQNISKGILAIGASIPEPSSIAILILGLILLYLNKIRSTRERIKF